MFSRCFAWCFLRKSTDDIPLFNCNNFKGYAKVVNVYDGDTFRACIVGPGDNKVRKFTFRPIGYDAPEMKPLKSTPNREVYLQHAKLAKDLLIEYLTEDLVWLECSKNDKYGRVLCYMYNKMNDEVSINEKMLQSGLVLPYDGKTKLEFNFESKE